MTIQYFTKAFGARNSRENRMRNCKKQELKDSTNIEKEEKTNKNSIIWKPRKVDYVPLITPQDVALHVS